MSGFLAHLTGSCRHLRSPNAPPAERPKPLQLEITAERAPRAPWQQAHADRVNREIEARKTAKEYRQKQREAERAAETHKQCRQCGETKPAAAFERLYTGGLRGTCKACRLARANVLKRRARATPEHQAEMERRARERPERKAATEAGKVRAREERDRAKEAEEAAARAAADDRRRKRIQTQRGIRKRPLSPERQREAEARATHLASLLTGSNPQERINTAQAWEAAAAELQRLWGQSGDKECVACGATVPPVAMLPPGPGNCYPGKCNRCARVASEKSRRATFGPLIGPLEGPRRIPMRDGTAITIGELARRHREREAAYRAQRHWS